MLHLWCQSAALLVPGCCTFTGTIIRKSLLFWYRYFLTFTDAVGMIDS